MAPIGIVAPGFPRAGSARISSARFRAVCNYTTTLSLLCAINATM
jgi:hypothetical protein